MRPNSLLTWQVELATQLEHEPEPELEYPLQRLVTLIRYSDTSTLLAILAVVNEANKAAGMESASAWVEYKEGKGGEVDILTGFQIVDSEARLFVLEGFAADGRNAMTRLTALLERKVRTCTQDALTYFASTRACVRA